MGVVNMWSITGEDIRRNRYRETHWHPDSHTNTTVLSEIGKYLSSKGLHYRMRYGKEDERISVSLQCSPQYWYRVLEPTIVGIIERHDLVYRGAAVEDPLYFYIKKGEYPG